MSREDHRQATEAALVKAAKEFLPNVKRQLKEPGGGTSFTLTIEVPALSSDADIKEATRLCKKDGWKVKFLDFSDQEEPSRWLECT